ncbi:MAG: TVP38/TMEM64 family protein [Phycisphaeraceae bacterium]|nr:TVP38/TMEM64 family protein [Phycisphaeraceae bacterium]
MSANPASDDTTSTRQDAPASLPARIVRFHFALGPTGLLGLAWVAMPPLAGIALLWKIKTVSEWLQSHGALGVVVYICAFVVLAGLGMLPTYAQAILGGWCFKFALGLPAALAGFVGASLLGYAVARTVSRHRVEDMIESNVKARAIRDALIGHGFFKTLGIVILLRLPPNSPFALTNLVMASAGVKIAPFALGTLIGMAPRTALAVYMGSGIQELTSDAFRPGQAPREVIIGGIVVTIIVVVVIGHIANRALAKVTSGGPTAPQTSA